MVWPTYNQQDAFLISAKFNKILQKIKTWCSAENPLIFEFLKHEKTIFWNKKLEKFVRSLKRYKQFIS